MCMYLGQSMDDFWLLGKLELIWSSIPRQIKTHDEIAKQILKLQIKPFNHRMVNVMSIR
jgi:hypothetical protein